MPGLILSNSTDVLDLDDVFNTGTGVQVTSGVTGLGLPPVALQWVEGAGDGATLMGRRVTAREIDLPLMLRAADRTGLKALLRRLTLMLAGPCTLTFTEDGSESWSTTVVRSGGGDYTYGTDTVGERDLEMVVTVQAGDPFFTSNIVHTANIKRSTGRGLLPKLSRLRLTSDQALGTVTVNNGGTTGAYPIVTVKGPGSNLLCTSPSGEVLNWTGTLATGDTMTLDFRAGTVVDQNGVNLYDKLAPAPRFWQIPPGSNVCTFSMDGATSDTLVTVTWRERQWVVI